MIIDALNAKAFFRLFLKLELLVHWTVTPYAIYSVLGLTFALSFYNLRMPFSISTLVRPLLGRYADGLAGQAVDGLGTFAVVLGMSATLVSAVMAISDGGYSTFGIPKSPLVFAMVAGGMMLLALIIAASGLQKGIQGLPGLIRTCLSLA